MKLSYNALSASRKTRADVLFWGGWVEWVVKSSVGVVKWSRLHRDEKIKAASERPRRRIGLIGFIGLRLNGLNGLYGLGGLNGNFFG